MNFMLSRKVFSCLLSDAGAPTKGRYMKVSCKPDAKNANCNVIKGPLIDIPNSRWGSAMGNDSSIFIFPEKELKKNLPAEKELKEEGFIL
uniref:Uncharacterized protein n=1 Tax=Paramormyrops kingsleyae TaxID=1676925 RepID=A0A3B3SZQ5_9TELE